MPLENTDAEERITRETMIGWIEHWGESYDDVRPDDGAMRLANRIIEYNAATETIEALRNPEPPKNPASRSSWRARPQPPIRTNRRWTS